MLKLGCLLAVLALAACATPTRPPSIDSAASTGAAPLHPIRSAYTSRDVDRAAVFLSHHPENSGVGGHEFDGLVLAMGRSHDKPNSLRITVLARDGTIWVVDPDSDSIADDVAALVGKGDWVIVHKHYISGASTTMVSDHDLRLVQKAA